MTVKTPLYEEHVALSGKIVDFAGFFLPVQYPTGVIAEHMAVREKAGLFDVSHMGEVTFKGKDALANINRIFTNDYTNLKIGKVRYGVMCYENGGCVDDLIVYRRGDDDFFVVVNASNRFKDVAFKVKFADKTHELKSDIVLQLNITYNNNLTNIRKINQNISQISSGSKVWIVELSGEYALTTSLTVRAFFQSNINTPYISNSYPNSTTKGGLTIRFSF